jgi:hypothetical protein
MFYQMWNTRMPHVKVWSPTKHTEQLRPFFCEVPFYCNCLWRSALSIGLQFVQNA